MLAAILGRRGKRRSEPLNDPDVPPVSEGGIPSWAEFAARVAAAGVLVAVPFVVGFIPGIIPGQQGTRDFYAATAQAIPTLLVAFAVGLPRLLDLFGKEAALDALFVAMVLSNFGLMILGEVRALQGLACPGPVCGTEEMFREAVFGLIAGGGLVVIAVLLALAAAHAQRQRVGKILDSRLGGQRF